jgi:hypothetical protein
MSNEADARKLCDLILDIPNLELGSVEKCVTAFLDARDRELSPWKCACGHILGLAGAALCPNPSKPPMSIEAAAIGLIQDGQTRQAIERVHDVLRRLRGEG